MGIMSAAEYQEKHNKRLKNALPEMRTGVERVTESPTVAAANKQEKMLRNLTEAVQTGKWAARLKAVSLGEWKDKMLKLGVTRVSQGIDAAAGKVQNFASQFLPFVDAISAETRKMDDLTLDDSIRRVENQIRKTAEFKMK